MFLASTLLIKFSIFLVLSYLITFLLLPVIINSVKLRQLYDIISIRNANDKDVPGFGGLPIFLVLVISLSLFYHFSNSKIEAVFLIPSCFFLFFTGIKDDLTGTSPTNKFLMQFIAAFFILFHQEYQITNLYGLLGINQISLWVSLPLSFLLIVFLVNAYNLIDGIDGLAGGLAIFFFSFFAFIYFILKEYHMTAVCLSLIGSFIAFLVFNLSKKNRIFLGDTGSLFIGFLIAAFVLNILSKNLPQHIHIPNISNFPLLIIAVLFIPIFDTLRVMVIRLKNGKKISNSDRNHIHHFITDDLKFSHYKASLIIISLNIIIFILTAVIVYFSNNLISILCLVLLAFGFSLLIKKLKVKCYNE